MCRRGSARRGVPRFIQRSSLLADFLGLNLIRVVSNRVQGGNPSPGVGSSGPLRLLDRGKLQMEERSYRDAHRDIQG